MNEKTCGFMVNPDGDRCSRPFGHSGSCDTSIQCHHCDREHRVPSQDALEKHIKKVHPSWATTADPEAPSIPESKLAGDEPPDLMYHCKQCDFVADSSGKLGPHTKQMHPKPKTPRETMDAMWKDMVDQVVKIETPPTEEEIRSFGEQFEAAAIHEPVTTLLIHVDPPTPEPAEPDPEPEIRMVTYGEFEAEMDWWNSQIADIQEWLPNRKELGKRYIEALVKRVEDNPHEPSELLDRIEKLLFPNH